MIFAPSWRGPDTCSAVTAIKTRRFTEQIRDGNEKACARSEIDIDGGGGESPFREACDQEQGDEEGGRAAWKSGRRILRRAGHLGRQFARDRRVPDEGEDDRQVSRTRL